MEGAFLFEVKCDSVINGAAVGPAQNVLAGLMFVFCKDSCDDLHTKFVANPSH